MSFTIKTRLIFALGCLAALIAVIGAGGFYSLYTTNQSLKTVYEDRLVAMTQLAETIEPLLRNQIRIARAIDEDPANLDAHVKRLLENKATSDRYWKEYLATFLTPEEKQLSTKLNLDRQAYIDKGLDPAIAALKAKDTKAAAELLRGPLTQSLPPLRDGMAALMKLQDEVGKSEFTRSQSLYGIFSAASFFMIAAGVLIAAGMGVWLVRSISAPLAQAVEVADAIACGDLTRDIQVKTNDEAGRLLQALKNMNSGLQNIVGEVRKGTETISMASSEIATGNMDLSGRTEAQAGSLEETASSMEELTSTVKQNADNARQANQLAQSASEIAAKGGDVVAQVVQTMSAINDSSKKIVDIIGVIDGIAFQTNILALNAAVEAARAGEQGRGFAVVASEVRSLAQRSAAAAKEIKTLINDSVEKVGAGSKLVGEAGGTMDEVVRAIRHVTDIMGEITAASAEQESGIGQINQAISQMDNVTQQNAALVEEAAAAAKSLQEQAVNLEQVVSVFKLDGEHAAAIASRPVAPARKAPPRPPAARTRAIAQAKPAPAAKPASGDEWEEF